MRSKVKILLLAVWFCFQSFSCFADWEFPPIDLSDNAQNASSPQIAMDAAGNGIAVWSWLDGGSNYVIQTRRYDATLNSWAAVETLSENTQDAFNPQIAMDSAGNGIAVWQWRYDGTTNVIQTRRYDATLDSWTAVETLSENTQDAYDPQIAMDPAGNGIAVWRWRDGGTTGVIQASRYDATAGSWTSIPEVETLSNNTQNSNNHQIAMDPAGNGIAVWFWQDGGATPVIQASRYDATSGSWTPVSEVETLSDNTQNAFFPQIAMDSAGNGIAVWMWQDGGTAYVIQTSRYDATADSWTPISEVETLSDNTQGAGSPQIAMDSAGNGIAVWQWQDGGTGNGVVQTSRYDATADSWTPIPEVETLSDNTQTIGRPQIAMNAAGNGIAVWQWQDGGTTYVIQTSRYEATAGSWTPISEVVTLSSNTQNAESPQIAMDPAGNGISVWGWYDDETGKDVIQTLLFSPDFVISSFSACKKMYRFPTQGDLIDLLTWDATEGAVSYQIYLDANLTMLIGKVEASENPCFKVHGRYPNKKTTYYVVAIDENGNRSEPASITI